MPKFRQSPLSFVLIAALTWHALLLFGSGWSRMVEPNKGRDFASYYYAVQAAETGQSPYNTKALSKLAKADVNRSSVHPFFYAPPFVAMSSWVTAFDLNTAHSIWFWLDELAALATLLVLWRWWQPLGPTTGAVLAVLFALMLAVPNNHAMGQANFPGLFLSIAGLALTSKGRPRWGGVLLGVACMLKMSPALFVAWWLLRREWVAVATACVTALVMSVLTLPFVGFAHQLDFYTHVLPSFATGDYNGLRVPVGLFGNHSIPNAWHQWFPGTGGQLSPTAKALSTATQLVLLAAVAWRFRRPTADRFQVAAQVSAVGILILLFPVYTYEHHLVFAYPAAVLCTIAAINGRLSPVVAAIAAMCTVVLVFDLQAIKAISEMFDGTVQFLLKEAKFVSLIGLFAVCTHLGVHVDEPT